MAHHGRNPETPDKQNRFSRGSGRMLVIGVASGLLMSYAWASMNPPTEHKDIEVEQLGVVPAESMGPQVGLDGHKLLLRRITIMPGGQIAKHSHASVPGAVLMESGSWIEGRESGEIEHAAGDSFIEDKDTTHWFFNRGEEPATAIVCDVKPAG